MVLCMPLVLNVMARMAVRQYGGMLIFLSVVVGGGVRICFYYCCESGVVFLRVNNLSRIDWVFVDERRGVFLCDMDHGVGKAMLMRGGACAAELRLMGVLVVLG